VRNTFLEVEDCPNEFVSQFTKQISEPASRSPYHQQAESAAFQMDQQGGFQMGVEPAHSNDGTATSSEEHFPLGTEFASQITPSTGCEFPLPEGGFESQVTSGSGTDPSDESNTSHDAMQYAARDASSNITPPPPACAGPYGTRDYSNQRIECPQGALNVANLAHQELDNAGMANFHDASKVTQKRDAQDPMDRQMTNFRFCPGCGVEVVPTHRFCPHCRFQFPSGRGGPRNGPQQPPAGNRQVSNHQGGCVSTSPPGTLAPTPKQSPPSQPAPTPQQRQDWICAQGPAAPEMKAAVAPNLLHTVGRFRYIEANKNDIRKMMEAYMSMAHSSVAWKPNVMCQ